MRQDAPRTPLVTPDLLRQKSNRETLSGFAAEANELNRRVDSLSGVTARNGGGSRIDALRRDSFDAPRSRPVMVPSSFHAIENKDIADIHTPVR